MTLDEALDELGLDRTASSDTARRAYLRLLKTRKPEVDPEGFLRLRAAYERAKEDIAWLERINFAVVAAEEEVVRSSRRGETAEAEKKEVPPAAPEDDPPKYEDPAKADAPAAAEEPRVEAAGEPERAVSAPPPPPKVAQESPPESAVPTISQIEKLILERKLKTAARCLAELYDAASRDPGVIPPSVFTTFDLLLRLHEADALKAADLLRLSFQAWLAATGEESRILRDHAAAIWTVIRELSALPDTFPSEVRALIARAAAGGNIGTAKRSLEHFAEGNLTDAMRASAMLKERAPMLAVALASALDAQHTPRGARSHESGQRSGGFKGWYALPIVFLGLLRMCAAANRGSSYDAPTVDYSYNSANRPVLLTGDKRSAYQAVILLSAHALIDHNVVVSAAVRSVESALKIGDCAGARAGMPALRAAVHDEANHSSAMMLSNMEDLERMFLKACAAEDEEDASTDATGPDADAGDASTKKDAGKTDKKRDASVVIDAAPCGGSP